MATRSQIGFYEKGDKLSEPTALIYRHWDGYPESVLPEIIPVLQDFDQCRGLYDAEFASAWLVAELKDYLGNIGISKTLHGDIEYYYAVYPGRIEIYKPKNFGAWLNGKDDFRDLKKLDTVKIDVKKLPKKYLS